MLNRFSQLIIFLLIAAAFTGCSPASKSLPLMQSQQSVYSTPPKEGYDRLVICRPWHFVSGGVYSAFEINDIPAVNFISGAAAFDVKPGKHKIQAKVTNYQSNNWGKGIVVTTQKGQPTIVKFTGNNYKYTLAPDFPLHEMTFYQPENAVITTNYYTTEDKKQIAETKKKKETQQADITEFKKRIGYYIAKKDYAGLKVYVNKNPRASYYIPDYKLRLLFIGPEKLQVGDIIKYKKKSMSDVLLAAKIKSSKTPYKQFSMEEIEMLQQYKISDTLIAAMIEVTTEIEKEMARDEKQRKYLQAQRDFAEQQKKTSDQSRGKTVAGEIGKEVGKEIGKQVVKSLINQLF